MHALEELYQSGVLTKEEFERKKVEMEGRGAGMLVAGTANGGVPTAGTPTVCMPAGDPGKTVRLHTLEELYPARVLTKEAFERKKPRDGLM